MLCIRRTRIALVVGLALACVPLTHRPAAAVATVFTQTYSATTAAGGTLMTAGNAATVTVARASLRDTVSNTGNTFAFPFAGSNTAIRSQFLMEQTQIAYGGTVDSIGLKLSAAGGAATFSNFTIKLVHTLHDHTSNTITTTFATNYDSNTPVTVFGPATLNIPAHAAGDLVMIDVANTFTYNNTNNLIVEVTWSNASATSDVAVVSMTDNGQKRWNVTATGSTVATTGNLGKDADYFVLRFAGDNAVVNPFDANNKSVAAGTGSTYTWTATSTGSGATHRWDTNGVLAGSVATSTISRTFYEQFLPSVTLNGTSAGNTVSTTAHTQFGASAAGSGKFGTFSDWADKGSTLTFSAATTPLGLTTVDTRSFTVNSALIATINYLDTTLPTVTVNAPNGGETYDIGSVHNITWTASDNVGVTAVDLAYSTDGGATYPNAIASGLANTGTYAWTVPSVVTGTARVRATAHDAAAHTAADASNANFSIQDQSAPSVTVNSPNGGEVWAEGSSHNITWSASDNVGVTAVDLDYSIDGGSGWTSVATGLANSGSYAWTVPGTTTIQARVRVTARDAALHSTSDISDANFEIRDTAPPAVHLTSPNGGEIWFGGQVNNITWTASDLHGVTSVDLLLSTDGGATYPTTIASGLANSGLYAWSVVDQTQPTCRVKVQAHDPSGNTGEDVSDADFEIRSSLTPVTMSGVSGEATAGHVELRWSLYGLKGTESVRLERRVLGAAEFALVARDLKAASSMTYRDAGVAPGTGYEYRISVGASGGPVNSLVYRIATPAARFSLAGASPNPFRGSSSIHYSLRTTGPARIEVVDIQGRTRRVLWNATQEAGEHTAQFDGRDEGGSALSSGIYFLRLSAGTETSVKRTLLLR